MIEQMLRACRAARSESTLPARRAPCEGFALVEAFRGDVFAHVRLAGDGRSRAAICATRHGSNGRCSRRRSRATSSPTSRSCNKSFNCSYSGCDL